MTTRTALVAALLSVSAAVAAVDSQPAAPSEPWVPSTTPLVSPAAPGSAQPQLTVSSRGVLLSWIERSGPTAALKFAERTPAGWTEARTVASGTDWFVNWADVPSVIRLADGTIYGHWLQKSGPGTYAYDVRLARSTDDGRTFSPSFTPHHDGTQTEHGFASLFQMPGARLRQGFGGQAGLGLVWLDGRAMKIGGHDGHGGGDMSVRAATFDPAGRQVAESAVDLRVCECCPTAAAVTADGPIVAYRDRSPEEIRDIYISRLVAGQWSKPAPVHQDGWKIAACPVNGPALSANGRAVAIAWFTAKGDEGHAYVAFSHDSGASFGEPIRLDDASAIGRVDVELLPDGSALATWIEFADDHAQLRARRIETSGKKSPSITVTAIGAGRASGYPRMARWGNEVVFAWTETGNTPAVRAAAARIPGSSTVR